MNVVHNENERSEEVAEALPDVRVTAIDHLWSDHNHILLHVSKSDFGPTPFKLFHSRLLRDSFDEVIKTELPKLEEYSFGRKLLSHEKFRLLKSRIKQWHSETKTSDCVNKHDNLRLTKSIEEKIETVLRMMMTARVKWDIEEKFKDHDLNVDFPPFVNSSGLCALDRDSLETPISLDEVKNAVWDCGSSKALGPDGACLSSSRASVLVNGSPTSEFSIKRALKQGCLLSPFLFILIMEGLHKALFTAVSSGLIRGVKFDSPEVTISHLFYADDVIITSEWNANDLDNIIRVLQVYYLALSLKINIQKSNVYGIGVSDVDVSFVTSNSGCALGSFHFTYLGLPIGFNMSLTSSWQVPESVLNSLERSREMFYKGVLKLLTSPSPKVALEVVIAQERALVIVIKALHVQESGFDNDGCIFKSTWARIVGSSNFLHSDNFIHNSFFRFQVGCDTRIRFWKDTWVGDYPFNIRYNRLYRLESEKDCLIIDSIDHGQWR
ncbi:RNA-directed DNA polymerase, eukaryota, reverse transcriptase zinc-binding domain protein [Tanacetum coccineum]